MFLVSKVESFILDQEDLDNPIMKTASELLLSSATDGVDLRTVDPETQARLEALLEAAGMRGRLSMLQAHLLWHCTVCAFQLPKAACWFESNVLLAFVCVLTTRTTPCTFCKGIWSNKVLLCCRCFLSSWNC